LASLSTSRHNPRFITDSDATTAHDEIKLGGTFRLPGSDITLRRIGYGAMQLPGKGVWG
jgi:hypothetical protein